MRARETVSFPYWRGRTPRRWSRSTGAASLAIAYIVATAGARAEPAKPDTVSYRVKLNDSLGLIASEFYGDRSKASFILAENKIVHTRPLRAGERLRIPIVREITTSPGDTFQALAETLFGDPRRGGFLAEINNMSPDDSLAAGTPILVPFEVTHTAAGSEPLAAIAANYYGDSKYAGVLQRYNNLDRDALDKGETIAVPSYGVHMHPTKLPPLDADSAAAARRVLRADTAKRAAAAIPIARSAWRAGDFAAVRAALVDVDVAFVELAPAIEIDVLLGSAHIAFDANDDARAVFKKLLERKPSHALRKFDHSPKVLAVWTSVGGLVE